VQKICTVGVVLSVGRKNRSLSQCYALEWYVMRQNEAETVSADFAVAYITHEILCARVL
jgi:hypothetical protein